MTQESKITRMEKYEKKSECRFVVNAENDYFASQRWTNNFEEVIDGQGKHSKIVEMHFVIL